MERLCIYCQKYIGEKGIAAHLSKLHKVTFQQYVNTNLNLFPDYHQCEHVECSNIISPRRSCCSKTCDAKVRKTWVGVRSPKFGMRNTPEVIYRMSQAKREMYKDKSNHPRFGTKLTSDHKTKISKTRISRGCSVGEKNGMYGKTHTPEAIKKIFEHKTMNKFEKAACDLLDQHSIAYKFQFFLNHNGTCKSYDIQIKDAKILVELDGDYWHGNPTTRYHHPDVESTKINDKLKDTIAEEAGFRVIRVWESEFKSNPSILIARLATALNEQATQHTSNQGGV